MFFLIQALLRAIEFRHYVTAATTDRIPTQHPLLLLNALQTRSHFIIASLQGSLIIHVAPVRKLSFRDVLLLAKSIELAAGVARPGVQGVSGTSTLFLPPALCTHPSSAMPFLVAAVAFCFQVYHVFMVCITTWMGKVHLLVVSCKLLFFFFFNLPMFIHPRVPGCLGCIFVHSFLPLRVPCCLPISCPAPASFPPAVKSLGNRVLATFSYLNTRELYKYWLLCCHFMLLLLF